MQKRHQPPHLYLNNTCYFITARTYNKQNILAIPGRRDEFLKTILQILKKHKYKIFGWVINLNHYHILIQTHKGESLKQIFHQLHGGTSAKWNKEDRTPGRKIWQNYFDTCIRNEASFYRHLNYIHHNPVKHRLVKQMKDYKWSSYNVYLKKYGEEWLFDCFSQYPIIDFSPIE